VTHFEEELHETPFKLAMFSFCSIAAMMLLRIVLAQGAKPTDLPIQQPTAIELTINLKTGKALGPAIPTTRADKIIE